MYPFFNQAEIFGPPTSLFYQFYDNNIILAKNDYYGNLFNDQFEGDGTNQLDCCVAVEYYEGKDYV